MAPTTRRMRARAAASGDRIPPDALFEALLCLPARDVCRLRCVCRSWRDLIRDPVFAAAHADAHRGDPPLFLAKFLDDKTSVYVVDLSGAVVKRVAGTGGGPYQQLLPTRLGIACVAGDRNRCGVLNPATGALQSLPRNTAPDENAHLVSLVTSTFFTLGRVAATGEHKVLRMFSSIGLRSGSSRQVFEVITVSSTSGGEGHGAQQWRRLQGPGLFIEECSGTVVDGVVYFMTSSLYDDLGCGIRPDYIVSFDLGREEWGRDIRGPISSSAGGFMPHFNRNRLALAELSGYLVLAEQDRRPFTLDLWYLVDSGRGVSGVWAKQYRIRTRWLVVRLPDDEDHLKPLLVLDDGRLVVYADGRMFICDLKTNSFKPIHMKRLDSVAVYTGNLLCLE
ncbi:unnamed protein product [Urochloa decumbens]|uniref:F-box domain-containing protein n=1 Tax=Urochloa decumbens TaxID=240449 RepID=A0ABC9EZJ2_9POAL